MGYHVEITDSDCQIAAQVKPQVYAIWCELNNPRHNHQKIGGQFEAGSQVAYWYSWMSETYDQDCKTVEEILDQLGFYYDTMADGGIIITGYDRKMGQEELFFKSVAHLLTGSISWCGEEDTEWAWHFHGSAQVLTLCQ